jgi:hypothetical protein
MRATTMVTGRTAVAMCLLVAATLVAPGGCKRDDGKVEMDLSTPRSAAMVFTHAVETGDAETAKTAAYAGGVEVEWVEAMTAAVSGMRTLVNAAEKKFGAEAYGLIAQRETLNLTEGLRDAEVKLEGNRAMILPSTAHKMEPLPMKNIDGRWKLDVGSFTKGEDLGNVVKQLRVIGEEAPKLAKGVESGKFQTVRDVQREMGSQVLRQAFNVAEPTSGPASPGSATRPQELPSDL